MDRDYIQLCAEIAYNEVIIENSLIEISNNEIISESFFEFLSKVKDRISKIGKTIIDAIKKLATKILDAIKELFGKIKNNNAKKSIETKIQKIKNHKKSKHESASLYESLMNMVLTEDTDLSYPIVNYEKIFDHMRSVSDQILKEAYAYNSKSYTDVNDQVRKSLKFALDSVKDLSSNISKDDVIDAIADIKDELDTVEENINDSTKSVLDSFISKCKFKYSNPSNISELSSSISSEYDKAKEDSANIIKLDIEDTDGMLEYAQSIYIDAYADVVKTQFNNAKKMFDDSIKKSEILVKETESTIANYKFTDFDNYNEAISSFLLKSLTMGVQVTYKVLNELSKCSVSASAVFAKLSADAISQANKLTNKVMTDLNIE